MALVQGKLTLPEKQKNLVMMLYMILFTKWLGTKHAIAAALRDSWQDILNNNNNNKEEKI
jgi:hypothetical protein